MSVVTFLLPRPLATWLALALTLVVGLVPARGFVLCIEPDGCVSVEMKADGNACGGCDDHHEDPSAPRAGGGSEDDAPCACLDLDVPGNEACRRAAPPLGTFGVELPAPPEPVVLASFLAPLEPALRGPPRSVPRVAQTLLHVRSIVLLV